MPQPLDNQIQNLMKENGFYTMDGMSQKIFDDPEKVQQLISLQLLKELKDQKKSANL